MRNDDLEVYIEGLKEAKKIVAEAFRAGYLYEQPVPYAEGWHLLNVLVRKAEQELEEFLDGDSLL